VIRLNFAMEPQLHAASGRSIRQRRRRSPTDIADAFADVSWRTLRPRGTPMILRPSSVASFLLTLCLAVPASVAHAEPLVALTVGNALALLDCVPVGCLTSPAVPVTGLAAGDTLVAIDTRPATGELYALAVNGAIAHLYRLNPKSGVAQRIGGDIALPQSFGVVAGAFYGFDFNPFTDRIRVVSDTRDNFRLNPSTGVVSGADATLTAGSVVVAAAYSDNRFGSASATTLYGIDSTANTLVRIGGPSGLPPSPNTGAVTTIGSLGIDPSGQTGFDITPGGIAYLAMHVSVLESRLYTVNLTSGAATITSIFPALEILGIAAISFRADVNDDGAVDVLDVFHTINFLFAGGPPPVQ
jgi:hypothetical protein